MVKQKMVIKVDMRGDKSRSRALKIVVGVHGVESAALGEKDKNQLEVIGEGVDPVKLTCLLRSKLPKWPRLCIWISPRTACAELISVSVVEKKDEKKEGKKDEAKPIVWCTYPQYVYQDDPYRCSIL